MGAAIEGLALPAIQNAEVFIKLLKRCRAALCWDDAAWVRDVEAAVESDAALVADIDAVIT